MPVITAKRIADYILCEATERKIVLTNLKLQKLLYYSQGRYLALTSEPLFPERIEAWVHGPVVPPVFGIFKEHRWREIPCPAGASIEEGNPDYPIPVHVATVLDAYGDFTGQELELLTHRESPWADARKGLPPDVPSNAIISHDSMRAYFSAVLANGK